MKDEHKQRQTLGGATLQNQGTSGMKASSDFPDHIKRVKTATKATALQIAEQRAKR